MPSPLKKQDRLDALAAEVRRLRVVLLECTRTAGELLDGEDRAIAADDEAHAARMLLDAKLALYFDESEHLRSAKCPIHGAHVLIVACPDCVRAWGFNATRCA